MVNLLRLPRRFIAQTSGYAMTETMMIAPLLIVLCGTLVETTLMMFQWNQTVKALQVGARRAAVSTPLTDISALTSYDSAVGQGDPVPMPGSSGTPRSVSCGAGADPCDTDALARLMNGSGLTGIQDIAPFIGPENIRVTYQESGLGYVGRPFGPVLTVTLEVRNLAFDLLLIDDLVPVNIPAHPVAITSEDLSDCEGTCS
ncbi:TadE/TadG family type IV pilus assembly protein [Salipiger sp. PrR002]|uniref:TadE/TadG family type IV pilus assembly protein n=1 Tax=Salipiger sp. PrR002 TaxID=2706489 RepID=UPI0013BE64C5|nr:TadE/TadG family type IV pilus assembly protein [Salipiger sp. PrR002]NDW01111.1 pilus assembly protein [Salipiger sp. PrR002]NDW57914.1 pilus assembly protein [Salipiger sp. PrR004]